MTDNDDPYPSVQGAAGEEMANYRKVSAQHAKVNPSRNLRQAGSYRILFLQDKQEMGVRFEQFFIERPEIGHKFDVRKFWQVGRRNHWVGCALAQ